MKKILVIAAILILGAVLGVGSYLTYQHFSSKESSTTKPTATVKDKESEKESKTEFKHRLDMELAVTNAEKDFFAMMNNYFAMIDKAVEDKRQSGKVEKQSYERINLLSAKIAFFLLLHEDELQGELLKKELLPLIEYYERITKKYGINKGLKENALIKTTKPKKEPTGLISGPIRSYTTSMQFKHGHTYETYDIHDTYIYRTNNGETKRVVKSTSYEKVDLNDYFGPTKADWNYTELSADELEYLRNKNIIHCDTIIDDYKLKGWYHISKKVDEN